MNKIISEVKTEVSKWREIATKIGISKLEQELMQKAFNL
jgi:serine/threonine-protein kinase HipA